MLKIGDHLGAYEIVAQLRRGGMATLYLGRRSGAGGFSKHVAIKVVHPHLADDPKFVEMFLDEARLSARIDHPNVVHVYDLGEGQDDSYYMAMEYVHGCSLSQLLGTLKRQGRKLSTELAVWIASRIAAGLHAAHELPGPDGEPLGVVHRDVSPQNVLLAYKGYVKLIDFGIAKARGRFHQTTTGLVKGKYRYMAPEQAAAQPVDPRTDEYALGVLLWEMLTMRRLFDAEDDLQLIAQVREPQVTPPRELVPEVPEALNAAVMRALAPDPADRFETMRDFQQALAQAVPTAPTLDAHDLGRLLSVVMADEIGRANEQLPDSVSRASHVPATAGEAADDVLRTMTVASEPSEQASDTGEDAGDTTADGEEAAFTRTDEDPGGETAEPATVADEPTPPTTGPTPTRPAEPPALRKRPPWRIVLPAAALLTALIAGLVFAVGRGGESDEPAAEEPLADTEAEATPEAPTTAAAPEPEPDPDPGGATGPEGAAPSPQPAEAVAADGETPKAAATRTSEDDPASATRTDEERAETTRERRRRRRLERRRRARRKPAEVDGVPIVEDVEF